MARETKVGLLAGLAFIICFAVILANRGANAPPGLANSILPNGTLDLPRLVQRNQQNATETAARASRDRTPPAIQPRPQQDIRFAGQNQPADGSLPATGAQLPVGANTKPAMLIPENTFAQNTRQSETPQVADDGLARALTSRPGNEYPLQPTVPASMTTGMNTGTNSAAYPPVHRPTNSDTLDSASGSIQSPSPPKGETYTVKPSDTLSSIASAHYGSKSLRAIETIFNANRGVLEDVNHVKSGMVLFIPEMPASTEAKSSAVPFQPAEPVVDQRGRQGDKAASTKPKSEKKPSESLAAAPSPDAKNFRWYQVQKNDRFASIAREQLGDAGRWQEVYEMNKDKFPDPQRIREGVRIKLPLTTVAQGKEKKR